LFFQSEYFEKEVDLCSSLLAEIKCPQNKNLVVLVYVYYSSSLTNNQEVVICSSTFSLEELKSSNSSGEILKIPMTSEYSHAAVSYFEIIQSFKPILSINGLNVFASMKFKNPMEKEYVFYEVNDVGLDATAPAIDAKEISCEPRLALTIPLKFLENFKSSIIRSKEAWKCRYDIERIRQGRFTSKEEAFTYNWREIKVQVIESKIRYSDINPNHSNITYIPAGIEDESAKNNVTTFKKGGFMGPKINEKEPNSFVQVQVQDEYELYSYNVGRTNTEYHMLDPIYGCNLNTSNYRKDAMDSIPDDAAHIIKNFNKSALFIVMEDVVNREIIRDAIGSSKKNIDEDTKYANQKLVVPIADTEFIRYIPNTSQAKIKFNVYFTNKNNDQILQGPAEIMLNQIGNNGFIDKWISVSLLDNCTCSTIKIRVQVSLTMDESIATNKQVPYVMSETLVYDNNNALDGSLYLTDYEPLNFAEVIPRCYEWMWLLGFEGIDPFVDRSTCEPGTINKRLDHRYPLHWMNDYILKLVAINEELETMITNIKVNAIDGNKTHRPSPLKTDMDWQPVPINLHYQLLLTRRHLVGENNDEYDLLDTVTCGATAAHGLGLKEGGLKKILSNVSGLRQIVDGSFKFCAKLHDNIVNMKGKSQLEALLHNSAYIESEMGPKFLELETSCLNFASRYCYCFSQCLSIAINGLLMKLSLLAEGKISNVIGMRWLECGFLIVFQSLLSISGKEKSMLEDTAEVVKNLSHMIVRILPLPASSSDENNSMTDVSIQGREVIIYMPLSVIEKLPELYQSRASSGGVIIHMVAALFTQGVDMNHYIASTTTNGENSAINFQIKINKMEGLPILNNYCHTVSPVVSDNNEPKAHPLLMNLCRQLGTKGDDLIKEVQDACIALGGCMITFCKSGKDRTGMVLTLQQSRFLSQYCGHSEQRIMKDANLMRSYGTRLDIAEKNTGKRVFAINQIQVNFLPPSLRPPPDVLEKIMTKDSS